MIAALGVPRTHPDPLPIVLSGIMIVAIVQHFVRPGLVEEAERRITANGDRMAALPGFLFRHVLVSLDDSHKLVTLTAWDSLEHYERWLQLQGADVAAVPTVTVGETPYFRVETDVFIVRSSQVMPLP